jgi:hypothetical protein
VSERQIGEISTLKKQSYKRGGGYAPQMLREASFGVPRKSSPIKIHFQFDNNAMTSSLLEFIPLMQDTDTRTILR